MLDYFLLIYIKNEYIFYNDSLENVSKKKVESSIKAIHMKNQPFWRSAQIEPGDLFVALLQYTNLYKSVNILSQQAWWYISWKSFLCIIIYYTYL